MNYLDESTEELRKYFKNNGSPDPYSMVREIFKALNAALKLVPESSYGNAIIILRTADAFVVQQFVTKFGCHLEYHHQINNLYSDYTIVPNWK